jgi:hypothetical protein
LLSRRRRGARTPNADVALIANNTIEKGPKASNSFAIHYGSETQNIHANKSLSVSGNTLIDDLGGSGLT